MAWFSGPDSPESHRRHSSHSPSRRSSSHDKDKDKDKQYYFVRPHNGSSSHTTSRGYSSRARPRDGYVNRIVHQIKRYLRDIYRYARRNPVKIFMLVIMPLITGGALADILRRFGIRLPASVQRMLPGGSHGGHGGRGGELGGAGGVEGLMKIAKMFI